MGFKRGDIIWARRVKHPQKWWPGLVLNIKDHLVSVSFFNKTKPHYFKQTEICSFQENFQSLVKTVKTGSKGERLLDFALKLISRRVYLNLRSRYNSREDEKEVFESETVLGFVHNVAVFPLIDVSDMVFAVTMAAQIHAFRAYIIGAHTVSQNSDDSELKPEFFNDDQPKLISWIDSEQIKPQPSHDMLVSLRCLALDIEYLSGESLNRLEQNVLILRKSAYETSLKALNHRLQKCSDSSSFANSQPNVQVNGNNCLDVLDLVASPTKFLGLKRQYGYSVDPGSCFKLCKSVPLFSVNRLYAYLQKGKIAQNIHVYGALISKPAFCLVSKPEVVMLDNPNAGKSFCLPGPDTTDGIPAESSDADTNGTSVKNEDHHLLVSSDYQYLRMKFPEGFSFPSKKDLIRKFSIFGKVDSARTKISTHSNSALVVFLHHLDAVAAYHYAKRRKSLFGEARIQFWLHSYEKKRRGPKFEVHSPKFKSCLKLSDTKNAVEVSKKNRKVRFLMES